MGVNGDHRREPEDMTREEREIAVFNMVRSRYEGDGELYGQLGVVARELSTNTLAMRDLTSAVRAGRPLTSSTPPVPPSAVATVFPPTRDKQQSSMDLEAIAKQAASILDDVDSESGEITKVTKMTANATILNEMIESARVNAYNRAARTARLKVIAVWIGIIGGGIPIVISMGALLLWMLRMALTYLKITPP